MALTAKSLDEITTDMVDAYDNLTHPRKIWRNNDNKLYLILRSIAAGFKIILDAILSLRSRFDPVTCDKVDLYTACKLVGTQARTGAGSILQITIVNTDTAGAQLLAAGVYNYVSVSGMIFSFELANDYLFGASEQRRMSAISRSKGSYRVEHNASIKLVRQDGGSINRSLIFSCADNYGQLGYPDEDENTLRERLVNDTDRQDHIKELELKIRNLPNIFECNLVFNQTGETMSYDDIPLLPWELLITITGSPTKDIAKLVAQDVVYLTHMVDPNQVVYYENDLYANGKFAVYYKYHDTADFSLDIAYQYNHEKLKSVQVEETLSGLLDRFVNAVTHIDRITEEMLYGILKQHNLPGVDILAVDIVQNGTPVPYLQVPKTRLPHLTGIRFEPVDTGATAL